MRTSNTIEGLNTIVQQLQDRLDKLEKQNIDLHQRRIINAANAVNNQDYATLYDLQTQLSNFATSQPDGFKSLVVAVLSVVNGSFTVTASPVIFKGPSFENDGTADFKGAVTNESTTDLQANVTVEAAATLDLKGPVVFDNTTIQITTSPITVDTNAVMSSHSFPLAKLSGGGSNGIINVSNGLIISGTDPT